MRRLARRGLPVDNPGAARLDLLTRALSARAVSGAAGALGLLLLGALAMLSVEPLMSQTCTRPGDCHYLYAWYASYDLFQTTGLFMVLAAILLFWFGRLPRVDDSMLRSATGSSR